MFAMVGVTTVIKKIISHLLGPVRRDRQLEEEPIGRRQWRRRRTSRRYQGERSILKKPRRTEAENPRKHQKKKKGTGPK